MSSLFDLLAQFLEPFLDAIPRIARRPASTEWMVIDTWLRGPRECRVPRLYVPLIDHVEYLPSTLQTIDCGLQRATTADGTAVAINATIRYSIVDPVLTRSILGQDWEEVVAQAVRADVCAAVMDHNYDHLKDIFAGVQDCIVCDDLYQFLDNCGIELQNFTVEDFQQVLSLSVLQ